MVVVFIVIFLWLWLVLGCYIAGRFIRHDHLNEGLQPILIVGWPIALLVALLMWCYSVGKNG